VIIVSASGKENVGKENRGFVIFLSYIFLSAGLDGRNDDHGPLFILHFSFVIAGRAQFLQ